MGHFLLLILKYYFIRNENEFRKTPAGGRPRGWIRNSPESTSLRFHCRTRNRGKGAPQAAGNFTIDYLLYLEYRVPNIYFYVVNVLRATQTRDIFNPAIGCVWLQFFFQCCSLNSVQNTGFYNDAQHIATFILGCVEWNDKYKSNSTLKRTITLHYWPFPIYTKCNISR